MLYLPVIQNGSYSLRIDAQRTTQLLFMQTHLHFYRLRPSSIEVVQSRPHQSTVLSHSNTSNHTSTKVEHTVKIQQNDRHVNHLVMS